ncbi:MAG: hypothetical protein CBARDMAM_5940 [uncultured Caballeronia sp.]|nr:MAG: hypothetical protein CBARDMAM_5940 [uncultured Caballeronia sp.]
MSELSGKVALITGGSRGIGAGIAHRLASNGIKSILPSPIVIAPMLLRRYPTTSQPKGGRAPRFRPTRRMPRGSNPSSTMSSNDSGELIFSSTQQRRIHGHQRHCVA